ncbi:MAG: hypothetical protein ACWA5A_06780, partial [Marinibacterium sp.]
NPLTKRLETVQTNRATSASLVIDESYDTVTQATDRLIALVEAPYRLHRLRDQLQSERPARSLTSLLAQARHKDWDNHQLFSEPEFLEGVPLVYSGTQLDVELIEMLLDQLDGETRTNCILSRAWIAIRSLMHAHYAEKQEPRIALLWNRALSHWSSATAWRGLHAHLWLGNVSALGSLVKARATNELPLFDFHRENFVDLHNSLGSVYYSLSKKVTPELRGALLDRSEAYVSTGLAHQEEQDQAGLLAIKGSIQLRRWHPIEASRTYRTALNLVEIYKDDPVETGMLLSELGWAEVCSGRFIAGRSKLKEGLEIMERATTHPGFLVRAKRKHLIASALNLRLLEVIELSASASKQVVENELLDQRRGLFSIGRWFGKE